MQIPHLYISETEHGRGVFTAAPIPKDSIIEISHVIVIPRSELGIIHRTQLHDYYFLWGKNMEQCAIALGYGSLYNHEVYPNADFILDIANRTIDFIAISDINADDQITINYHGEVGAKEELWF